jgi:hypothetical protein
MQSLIPLRSGLAKPAEFAHDSAGSRDAVSYRSINGAIGELHVESDAIFRLVDGRKPIGEIETTLARTESPEARRGRWMELAGLGFLLLKSPDPRQHVDCVRLGSIKDRLDCGCPRRWLRGCEKHGFCTLSTVGIEDPQFAVLQAAVRRSGIESAPACDRCPDYSPDV